MRRIYFFIIWFIVDEQETHNNTLAIAPIAYSLLAQAYAMLNRLELAEYYLEKSTESPFTSVHARLIQLRARSLFESSKDDNINALETFKQYNLLTDSLHEEANVNEIARLRMWHELEMADAENNIMLALS